MVKKFLIMSFCILVTSFFSIASAHDGFTWFGLRRNNTEIMFQTSDSQVRCDHPDCHRHKHKPKPPKPKHKHKPDKKGPNPHKWWKRH